MVAAQEVSVREAARRAGRTEETIRRWIWSGRLPAVKRGTGYRIDVAALEDVILEMESGVSPHGRSSRPGQDARGAGGPTLAEWLQEVDGWKQLGPSAPGPAASELLIEDRRARR